MHIIQIKAENFKKLKAIDITPDENVNIVSGKNANGKSSLLDAIMVGIAGSKFQPIKEPIRQGEKSAKIQIDLGEYILTRTFTPSGSKLEILAKDGTKVSGPQDIINNLLSGHSFDPVRFINSKPKEQLNLLLQCIGLEFNPDELNAKKDELFKKRTDVNREAKSLEAELGTLTAPGDGEDLSVLSASEIIKELTEAQKQNETYRLVMGEYDATKLRYSNCASKIEDLKKALEAEEALLEQIKKDGIAIKDKLSKMSSVDTTIFTEKLEKIESINTERTEKRKYVEKMELLQVKVSESEKLTHDMEEIEQTKRDLVGKAKMPLKELSFDESGITYKGVPFENCSSAEQLRIALVIAVALNPELRVVIIKDGNLLDNENLQMVKNFARKTNVQVWIEKVDDSGQIGIVIEDGEVASVNKED